MDAAVSLRLNVRSIHERLVRFRASLAELALPGCGIALAYAGVAQGAYYRNRAVAFSALLVALAVVSIRVRLPRSVIAGGIILGAALLGSAARNGWPAEFVDPVLTLVGGAGAFVLGRALVRRGERAQLLVMLSMLGAGVAIIGIVGVAFRVEPLAMQAHGIWRLASTLTYANSAAALLVLTLPAALLGAQSGRTAPKVRAFLITTGLLATMSRGVLIALIVAAICLALAGGASLLRTAVRPAFFSLFGLAAMLPSITGETPVPALAVVGVTLAGAASVRAPGGTSPWLRILATVLVAATLVPLAGSRLLDARFSVDSEDRLRSWAAVTEQFGNTLWGTGPGTFSMVEAVDGELELTRYAHNEYLQAYVETGVVGLVAVLVAGGLFWTWLVRRRRGNEVWFAALAACAAFTVHSALDFIWRVPLIVVVASLWLAIGGSERVARREADL